MAKIAYIRVSTTQQHTDRQEIALNDIGMDKIFKEKISGVKKDRPELKKMLDYAREGDTLYIESISRLGRSLHDLINIVGQLGEKKVDLVSLKEKIDTSTPQGKLFFHITAALAEFERENMLQRSREGIDAAKIKGTKFGRPRVERPKTFDDVVAIWKSGKITAVEAQKRLGLNRMTFYRLVKSV